MEKWRAFRNSPRYEDAKGGVVKKGKNLLMTILQIILIVGISYVILSPVIGIVAQSFFSDADSANPMVYTIPIEGTLERYTTVITQMDYFRTLGNTLIYTIALTLIQVLICSMVGYGFARFDFPLKKLLFGCVVLMIVIPNHTIMLPQYDVPQHGLDERGNPDVYPDALRHRASRGFVHLHFQPVLPRSAQGNRGSGVC